jgi:secreted trypsin-like serine protease
MTGFTAARRQLLAAATLALCLPAAQASTAAYDAMVASGQTQEGIYPRIVIRDNIGQAGSASFAANVAFAGVVGLGFSGGQYCSGVLIAPTTVLSARHCAPVAGEFVRFGTNFASPTFSSNIQSVLFPGGGSASSPLLDGGDVAIVRLATAVPSSIATPFLLSDATTSLVGFSVATIGYGASGIGSTGATVSDDIRRGGTNVLDRYGAAVTPSANISGTANIFSTDFDNPAGTSNTLGWLGSSAMATTFEATTASGDSGGPLLIDNGGQWTLVGVLSGGTTSNSVYGDISWWTGVAPFRAQIEAAGGVFTSVVPEPGTYGLMLLGLGVVGVALRRRSAQAPT